MKFIGITIRRIFNAMTVLLTVIVLNFILMHLAPGDVVDVIVGEMGGASQEQIVMIRAMYGLDNTFLEQLFVYLHESGIISLSVSILSSKPSH